MGYIKNLIDRYLSGTHQNPIFIAGGRRTGTTLLHAILCSSDSTNLLGQESQILTRFFEAYKWGNNNFEGFGNSFFKDRHHYQRTMRHSIEVMQEEMRRFASPRGRLVMKNPELSFVISEIIEIFPRSPILIMIRDPRDQLVSEYHVWKRRSNNSGSMNDFKHEDLLRNYITYYEELFKCYDDNRDNIHVIEYEQLVLHPEIEINRISDATGLNLSFDPYVNWKRVSKHAALDKTPSRSENYGKAITNSSLGTHHKHFSIEEAEFIWSEFIHIYRKLGLR